MKKAVFVLCLLAIAVFFISCGKDLAEPRPFAASFTGKLNGKPFTFSTNEVNGVTFIPFSIQNHIAEKDGLDSIYSYYYEFGMKGSGIASNVNFKFTKGIITLKKEEPLIKELFSELFKVEMSAMNKDFLQGTSLELNLPDTLPRCYSYTINDESATDPDVSFDVKSATLETLYGRTYLTLLVKIKKCILNESLYMTEKDILTDGVLNMRVYMDDYEN